MEHLYDRDCTSKCRSSTHAQEIFTCIPSASASQIRAYSVWICHNFPLIIDNVGKNMLHVAASCGKWEIVEWLVANCNVDIDVKDHESGWTALHRSYFYGQLCVARVLCKLGTNLKSTDHEGFTPLDIILKDRLPYIEYIPSHPSEVYAWGSNLNYNLGFGYAQSRNVPEILEVFRKDSINIKQVTICKFHTAFLSSYGKVYTCGYGHGGRLGQGNEDISLMPSLVKGIGSLKCVQIAAGQDHLLLLIEGGQVLSCGLNTYHQLGHVPPTEKSLVPKPLSLKFLKGKEIIGISAARFHSVIYTKDSVYTFGLNAGQLGHPKGDRTQINPRQVSTLYHNEWKITHVGTSDGATVCATNRGDIYVLHEYQTRKIASRQLDISKLTVIGGHLDSKCDVAGVREGGGLELRVMLLTKSGKIYLWRQSDPYLRRCLFTTQKKLIIFDIHINHYSIGLITSDNEGYIGSIVPYKGQRSAPTTNSNMPAVFYSKAMHGLNVLLDTNECHFIKVKRLPHIHRGTFITSDSKGRNYAVIQSDPKMGLVDLPMISESNMFQDFTKLYTETCTSDDFHDIIIKVGKREFAAHKYILASRSDFFKKQISSNFKRTTLSLENVKPEAFEQILKFIYTNHCDFLCQGYEVHWQSEQEVGKKKKSNTKTSKATNPINILQETSKKLGMNILVKKLERIKCINGHINIMESSPIDKISYDQRSLSQLCDVNLLSSDGSVFRCHKCILIARLDYFHSMLSTFWLESSQLENLPLPIPSKVLEVLLNYIYTDKADKVLASEDPEFLYNVLLTTDQLLMPRLKEICEVALIQLINLKNAAEFLELASVYNALQLKQSCMQFITINLAAMIEAKAFDVLSNEVMLDLTKYYRDMVPSMTGRRIFYTDAPSIDTLDYVEKCFPVDCESTFIRNRLDLLDTKIRKKRRNNSTHKELVRLSSNVEIKSNSESSEKDIILDVVLTKIDNLMIAKAPDIPEFVETTPNKSTSKKCEETTNNSHQCVATLFPEFAPLNISMEKQPKLCKSDVFKKPIPRLSQKQKKLQESKILTETSTLNSPPKTSCPWAKLSQQSPPSPSFWDAAAKKDFPLISNSESKSNSQTNNQVLENILPNQPSNLKEQNTVDTAVISLYEIQKDEQQKLQKVSNPVIKPLHILNIEDQAIEELLILYNAKDNPKEKITISRVLPEVIAAPIWKKHTC